MKRFRIVATVVFLTMLMSFMSFCALTRTYAAAAIQNCNSGNTVAFAGTSSTETTTANSVTINPLTTPTWNLSVNTDAIAAPTFKLPSSLRIIEDEAFEGTAIVAVELPEKVESIGARAFSNIHSLRMVKIPSKTGRIATTAFANSDKVTITAAPGSYARAFSQENGLPFAPIAVMTASTSSPLVINTSQVQRTSININTTVLDSDGEETPRWRPVDEIHTEQYDQCIAHCIIGRAPPACA